MFNHAEKTTVKTQYLNAEALLSGDRRNVQKLDLLIIINETLDIFKYSKQTLLYKLMIELFNDRINCNKYIKLKKNIIDNRLYYIKYKNKKYIFDYLYIFHLIQAIRKWSVLSYDFY